MTTTTKKRVHQVAKEFNISTEALTGFLAEHAFEVHSPMTAVPDEIYELAVKRFTKEPVITRSADQEFRRHIRDKKLEEEKEKARARQQYDERLRVTTNLMESRTHVGGRKSEPRGTTATRTSRTSKHAPEEVANLQHPHESVKPHDAKLEPVVAKGAEPVARAASEAPLDARHVPTLHERVVSLITQEDLHSKLPIPNVSEHEVKVVTSEKPKTEPKGEDAADKKKKKRRRRKKKSVTPDPSVLEDLGVTPEDREEEFPKEKIRHLDAADASKRTGVKKPKKRKKKISEEEIEESIRQTLAAMESVGKPRPKRRRERGESGEAEVEDESRISVPEFISASDLSKYLHVDPSEVIRKCLSLGMIISINQRLDGETIITLADEFGYDAEIVREYGTEESANDDAVEETMQLRSRPPVVTIMGHVDHGKTSLLDFLRKSNITAGESGGITQHIGAYEVGFNGRAITFLDTPGHEAFTAMRARGAKATDIVILVVAADDGVQQQTLEAVSHARAASVPMVVAINKIDKGSANPDSIKQQLAQHGVLVESWGGKVQSAEISAKKGTGIEHLLELVLLEADLLDLKANPERRGRGIVVEAELDKGKGPVATVLVQTGTLRIGDPFVAGHMHGKVRAMYDENGRRMHEAPPSRPVRVVGFSGVPSAGDLLTVMTTEQEAKEVGLKRQQLKRAQDFRKVKHMTLDQLSKQVKEGAVKELHMIVKGDMDGSVEALSDSLLKLSTNEVAVKVIHKGVGGISESDVLLAAASDAVVFGFHVRATQQAREIAEHESVDIRLYKIIYDAVNDVKAALEGMLEPELSEQVTSSVNVRETFKIPKVGTIAGCYVQSGKINRNDNIRLYRNDKLIHEGKITSLKRFKDDAREVASGFECGVGLAGYDDVHVGDVIESFQVIKTKRTLAAASA
ncbi:MAG: translation initiation factor IF-2 [candidate division KSB1 bacterium]